MAGVHYYIYMTTQAQTARKVDTSVETSVSITNERSVQLTSKLSSELTSFIDVANMIIFLNIFFSKY